MVHSVGIDLVEAQRIENSISRFGRRFVNRILGTEELVIYDSRKDKVGFLAGRFAAKEAIIKSLGKFLNKRPGYNNLQILNDGTGNPFLKKAAVIEKVFENRNCLLSISHERNFATAVAMITED